MDDRLRICLWMVGGGGLGAALGGVFGAVAAAQLYARCREVAGTQLARRVVESFLRSGEHPPSRLGLATLVGAADGFFFLGSLGLVGGALLGTSGRAADEFLVPIVLGSVLLVGGAILFGVLAYALTHHAAALVYAAAGAGSGSFLAALLLGADYSLVGLVPGLCLGLLLGRAVRHYSPRFHPPHVWKPFRPQRLHSDADTKFTDSPPPSANDELFHKPDTFEEK
jgi:hypothetical protein